MKRAKGLRTWAVGRGPWTTLYRCPPPLLWMRGSDLGRPQLENPRLPQTTLLKPLPSPHPYLPHPRRCQRTSLQRGSLPVRAALPSQRCVHTGEPLRLFAWVGWVGWVRSRPPPYSSLLCCPDPPMLLSICCCHHNLSVSPEPPLQRLRKTCEQPSQSLWERRQSSDGLSTVERTVEKEDAFCL